MAMKTRRNFIVSVTVHDRPRYLVEQAENMAMCFRSRVLVLAHVSAQFRDEFMAEVERDEIEFPDNVVINPNSVPTSINTLTRPHFCNFRYADENYEFEYMILHSRSDLYFKRGVDDYIKQFDVGVHTNGITDGWWHKTTSQDQVLQRLVRDLGLPHPYASSLGGTFYRREILRQIIEILSGYEGIHDEPSPAWAYPKGVVLFPTVLVALARQEMDRKPIGSPHFRIVNQLEFGNIAEMDNVFACKCKMKGKKDAEFRQHVLEYAREQCQSRSQSRKRSTGKRT